MPCTVIGLFDTPHTAREVEQALADADFEPDRVLLAAGDSVGVLAPGGDVAVPAEGTGVPPIGLDLVETFVQHGVPRERAEHYAGGIKRGGAAVLLLDLSDADAERAADVLRHHRPVDPSRRLQALREFGHGGYGPVANPFGEGETIPEIARYADDHYGDDVAVIYVM